MLNQSELILKALVKQFWVIFQHPFYAVPWAREEASHGAGPASCNFRRDPALSDELPKSGCETHWRMGRKRDFLLGGFQALCRRIGPSTLPHVSLRLICPIEERLPSHPPLQSSHLSYLWNPRSSPRRCSGQLMGKKPDVASCAKQGGSLQAAPQGHEPATWNCESSISENYPAFAVVGGSSLFGSSSSSLYSQEENHHAENHTFLFPRY